MLVTTAEDSYNIFRPNLEPDDEEDDEEDENIIIGSTTNMKTADYYADSDEDMGDKRANKAVKKLRID